MRNLPNGTGARHKLQYTHDMLRQLRQITKGERLDFLTHMIDMAYFEAGECLRDLEAVQPERMVDHNSAGSPIPH